MRYRGQGTNWLPILITIAVAVVALAIVYFMFLAPKPAGVSPTLRPTPTLNLPTTSPS